MTPPRASTAQVLRGLAAPAAAVGLSLVVGAVIMALSGVSPAVAYVSLLRGALGSPEAIARTLQNATPLILTGIAVAVAFRGGLFNIGGDGQFAAGATAAAWAGVTLSLPPVIGPVAVLALGGLAGGLVGALAGALKARFGAHEVVTTIMLNFIVADLSTWLLLHPLSAHSQVPGSDFVLPSNRLPMIGGGLAGAHVGLAVALAGAVVASVVLWRTPYGMELRVSGLAPRAARYMGTSPTAAAAAALGGGGLFAGLAGAGEVLGTYGHMTVPFVTNLGYLGIGVALLGRNHPLGCVVGGLVLGALSSGGQQMQFDVGISAHLIDVLVGVVLLFVTVQTLRRRTGPWPRAARLAAGGR
ncbi:ABC transporter permease [Acrocarpospora sp. B8E8]|uniref:ABC transporter permease n=1 Tax=Acrocarpospora sp. B8E8 TaxID=3153572 RepID=UPI00325F0644